MHDRMFWRSRVRRIDGDHERELVANLRYRVYVNEMGSRTLRPTTAAGASSIGWTTSARFSARSILRAWSEPFGARPVVGRQFVGDTCAPRSRRSRIVAGERSTSSRRKAVTMANSALANARCTRKKLEPCLDSSILAFAVVAAWVRLAEHEDPFGYPGAEYLFECLTMRLTPDLVAVLRSRGFSLHEAGFIVEHASEDVNTPIFSCTNAPLPSGPRRSNERQLKNVSSDGHCRPLAFSQIVPRLADDTCESALLRSPAYAAILPPRPGLAGGTSAGTSIVRGLPSRE
jgi:hypothetical protein